MTTALGDGEILSAIVVPAADREQGSAYVKFSHPASRYAVIGVAARRDRARRHDARSARVALGGLLPARAPRRERSRRRWSGKTADTAAIAAAAAQVRRRSGRPR